MRKRLFFAMALMMGLSTGSAYADGSISLSNPTGPDAGAGQSGWTYSGSTITFTAPGTYTVTGSTTTTRIVVNATAAGANIALNNVTMTLGSGTIAVAVAANNVTLTLNGVSITTTGGNAIQNGQSGNGNGVTGTTLTLAGNNVLTTTNDHTVWTGSSFPITITGAGTLSATSINLNGLNLNGLNGPVTLNGDVVVRANKVGNEPTYTKGILFAGGTGSMGGSVLLPGDLTVAAGETLTIPAGATLIVPAGATLTNSGTLTNNGTLYLIGNASLTGRSVTGTPATTLPNPAYYAVAFNSNGGTAVDTVRVLQLAPTLRAVLAEPTRDGYAFGGWYADNGTFQQRLTLPATISSDTTLYARWWPIDTITFHSRGGSAVADQLVTEGKTTTAPADPTRASYAFGGWYTDSTAWSHRWNFATDIVWSDTTLYARWAAIPDYLQGWTVANGTQPNKWYIGTAHDTAGRPVTAYISNNGGQSNAYANGSMSIVHLYKDFAIPADARAPLLMFDWKAEGEDNCDYLQVFLVPTSTTPMAGTELVSVPNAMYHLQSTWQKATIDIPADYIDSTVRVVFTWRNDGSDGNDPPAAIDSIFVLSNSAYYAVAFNSNGGTAVDIVRVPQAVPTLAAAPAVPTKAGYAFGGWYADNGTWAKQVTLPATISSDTTLYARWVAVPDYLQGWTVANGTQANKWYTGTALISEGRPVTAYVSNDGGTSNAYTNGSTSIVHLYKDFAIPADAHAPLLMFDWTANGERANSTDYDYLRVFLVPTSVTPEADKGVNTSTYPDNAMYNLQSTWQKAAMSIPESYLGGTVRVVFSWTNDRSYGDDPPAAIDSIFVRSAANFPTTLYGIADSALRTVALPKGYAWANPTETMDDGAGLHSYAATYTASADYNAVPVALTVRVANPAFSGGTGTETDPYLIANADDLWSFSILVELGYQNNDNQVFYSKKFKQTADIVLNTGNAAEWGTTPPAVEWMPIGRFGSYFGGTYDGGYHTVSGMYINQPKDDQGLFGYLLSCVVRNLGVVNSYVKGRDNVGALVGRNYIGLGGCYAEATVIGRSCVGGLVGFMDNPQGSTKTMGSCYAKGSVSGSSKVGGLCGSMGSTMNDSYAAASVVDLENPLTAGGLTGYSEYAYFEDCYYDREVAGVDTAIGSVYSGSVDVTGVLAGLSTAEMKSGILFPGWVASTWSVAAGKYPRLSNFSTATYGWYQGHSSPYYISTAADLRGLANIVNGEDGQVRSTFSGDTIYLAADIDLNPGRNIMEGDTAGAEQWQSIGEKQDEYMFRGTFDGQGHIVSGLYGNGSDNFGLFGYVYQGTIKNVGINNAGFYGCMMGAALVGGAIQQSTVVSCFAQANVNHESSLYPAVLVGFVSADAVMANCYAIGYGKYKRLAYGKADLGTIIGCYDNNTGAANPIPGVASLASLDDFKSPASYAPSWHFGELWTMDDGGRNDGFPVPTGAGYARYLALVQDTTSYTLRNEVTSEALAGGNTDPMADIANYISSLPPDPAGEYELLFHNADTDRHDTVDIGSDFLEFYYSTRLTSGTLRGTGAELISLYTSSGPARLTIDGATIISTGAAQALPNPTCAIVATQGSSATVELRSGAVRCDSGVAVRAGGTGVLDSLIIDGGTVQSGTGWYDFHIPVMPASHVVLTPRYLATIAQPDAPALAITQPQNGTGTGVPVATQLTATEMPQVRRYLFERDGDTVLLSANSAYTLAADAIGPDDNGTYTVRAGAGLIVGNGTTSVLLGKWSDASNAVELGFTYTANVRLASVKLGGMAVDASGLAGGTSDAPDSISVTVRATGIYNGGWGAEKAITLTPDDLGAQVVGTQNAVPEGFGTRGEKKDNATFYAAKPNYNVAVRSSDGTDTAYYRIAVTVQAPKLQGAGTAASPYVIATADDLIELRDAANAGYKFNSCYVVQTADIDLNPGRDIAAGDTAGAYPWTPIGCTDDKNFYLLNFHYDGQGHTVRGVYVPPMNFVYAGLFGNVHNSTLTGIGVVGSYINAPTAENNRWMYVGGLVASANESTISRCYSEATLASNNTTNSYMGGLIGELNDNSGSNSGSNSVDLCYATGKIVNDQFTGGLIGRIGGTPATVSTCYAAVELVVPSTSVRYGGLVGNDDISSAYTACYFDSAKATLTYAVGGDNSTDPDVPQSNPAGTFGKTTAEMQAQSTYTDWDFDWTWRIAAGEYPTFLAAPDTSWHSGTAPYYIATAEELRGLAYLVNTNTGGQPLFNNTDTIYLTADIDLNPGIDVNRAVANGNVATVHEWVPIGKISNNLTANPFSGVFDGQGHTVSGIYINSTDKPHLGLFGIVDGGTLRNVGVVNAYVNGNNDGMAGGLAGVMTSNVTVSQCYSEANVSDLNFVGSLIGAADAYGDDTVSISDCYATGSATAKQYAGALIGHIQCNVKLTSCYGAGAVSGATTDNASGGMVGDVSSYCFDAEEHPRQITSCYYDKTSNTAGTSSGGEAKSTAEMQPADNTTTFTGWDNGTWFFLQGHYPRLRKFIADELRWYEQPAQDDPRIYEIATADELRMFSELVNAGTDFMNSTASATIRLTADIELNPGVDVNKAVADGKTDELREWTPIGSDGNNFIATFDGQGHTVSGVYVNNDKLNQGGLFGAVTSSRGKLRNVGVVNAYVKSSNPGGLVGKVTYSATVEQCYSEATVSSASTAGGLIGHTFRASISDCYATGSVTGGSNVGALIGYIDDEITLTRCYGAGAVQGTEAATSGGLVGGVDDDEVTRTITNCYYNSELIATDGAGATPKTTAEMQQQSTYTGWDFGYVWSIDEGRDYPRLRMNAIISDSLVLAQTGDATYAITAEGNNTNLANGTTMADINSYISTVNKTVSLKFVGNNGSDTVNIGDARITLTGGTWVLSGGVLKSSNSFAAINFSSSVSFYVVGASVLNEQGGAVGNFSSDECSIIVTDGTLFGNIYAIYSNAGRTDISGGTITSDRTSAVAGYAPITIGGTATVKSNSTSAIELLDAAMPTVMLTITGGTLAAGPGEPLVDRDNANDSIVIAAPPVPQVSATGRIEGMYDTAVHFRTRTQPDIAGLDVAYQWTRNKADIIGATDTAYVLRAPSATDNGCTFGASARYAIKVRTTTTPPSYDIVTSPWTPSDSTITLRYYPDISGTLAIAGSARWRDTLRADLSNVRYDGTPSYVWLRGTNTVGTAGYYAPEKADIGQRITLTVSSSERNGSVQALSQAIAKTDGHGTVAMADYTFGHTPSTPQIADTTGTVDTISYDTITGGYIGKLPPVNVGRYVVNVGINASDSTDYCYAVDTFSVEPPRELSITGGTENVDYSYSFNVLTILRSGTYEIGMAAGVAQTVADKIVVQRNSGIVANITLRDVKIDLSNHASDNIAAFDHTGATVNLTLVGDNVLKSKGAGAGLTGSGSASTLLITSGSTGSLTAVGGTDGAGIGGWGGDGGNGGNISIDGGTITATGGRNGAGIGGGYRNDTYPITINGGTITATGGENAAGIGGGYRGYSRDITISGGTVTATGGLNGAGIGGGLNGWSKDIAISGGNVTAQSREGAGIGGGCFETSGGNIVITGGTVAAHSESGAGIGAGFKSGGISDTTSISGGTVVASSTTGGGIGNGDSCTTASSALTITGGSIKRTGEESCETAATDGTNAVYLTTLTVGNPAEANKEITAIAAPSTYGIHDVHTDNAGKLYFWLPEATNIPVSLTANSKEYSGTASPATDNSAAATLLLPVVKYRVTFVVNNTVAYTDSVAQDSAPVYRGATPLTRPATAEYSYTFKGWTYLGNLVNLTEIKVQTDMQLIAAFDSTPNEYYIAFERNNGMPVDTIRAAYGTPISEPTPPTKDGYNFGGWYTEAALITQFSFGPMPAQNTTLYAKWVDASIPPVNSDTTKFAATVCYGEAYTEHGFTLPAQTASATHYQSLKNQTAGDSIVRLDLTVLPQVQDVVIYDTIDFGQTYTANGFTETASGTHQHTTPNVNGCDSTTVLHLFVRPEVVPPHEVPKYTITFVANGGSETPPIIADSGSVVSAPAAPTREGYTFGGWYRDQDCKTLEEFKSLRLTGNLTLYAGWQANSYTITFNSNGGSPVSSITKPYGEAISAPTPPTKDGHNFGGWYTDNGTFKAQFNFGTMPARDTTLYAKWVDASIPTYTITWRVAGVEMTTTVEKDTMPVYNNGATPTRPRTPQWSYSFTEWNPAIVKATANATYTALFDSTQNVYHVTWVVDGVTVETDNTEYGALLHYDGAKPTRAATAEYSYTFKGWFNAAAPTSLVNLAITKVQADMQLVAAFDSTKVRYRITWLNYNDTQLGYDSVPYGNHPLYDGPTPTKPANAEYEYVFEGWENIDNAGSYVDLTKVSVTTDMQLRAVFRERKLGEEYHVTWVVDGVTVETDNTEYGALLHYDGAKPTRAATAEYTYTFKGWLNAAAPTYIVNLATTKVQADMQLVAAFDSTKVRYRITWLNYDNTPLDVDSVPYGNHPLYDGPTPVKPANAEYEYVFESWENRDNAGSYVDLTKVSVTTDMQLRAVFRERKLGEEFVTVTFNSQGGSPVDSVKVKPGDHITKPANPTRKGYTFVSWCKDPQGLSPWNFATDIVRTPITLYAKWSQNPLAVAANARAALTLYPNPTAGELTINNYQLTIGDKVSIYNLQGVLVMTVPVETLHASSLHIDLTPLPSGTYIIRVGNAVGTVVKK